MCQSRKPPQFPRHARRQMATKPAGKIATSGLDAMDVEFDIRSSKPLHNPYVVTMTRFHARNSRPGMVQNMVYAQSLHPIDEHLSHVHFVEEGFPFDYELIDFQLHIYNRGEEIATNVAADRVELTREEAFEYVKSEYIGAHSKDTLPAMPAMAKLPADLPAKLAQNKYSAAYYVKVSKDGAADEAYLDAAMHPKDRRPVSGLGGEEDSFQAGAQQRKAGRWSCGREPREIGNLGDPRGPPVMQKQTRSPDPRKSLVKWLVPALSMAAPVCFSNVSSDGQAPHALQSEVSRAAVTTMPALRSTRRNPPRRTRSSWGRTSPST